MCLDYNTFVCSACSGVQYVSSSILRACVCACADRIVMNGTSREFGHRVKSVSMASFKPEEIERIKKGGNDVRVICYCYYCCCPLMLVGH